MRLPKRTFWRKLILGVIFFCVSPQNSLDLHYDWAFSLQFNAHSNSTKKFIQNKKRVKGAKKTKKRAKKGEAIIMKYPAYTVSQRLSTKEARKIIEALEKGTTISNPEYRATIQTILKENNLISHSKSNANGSKAQIRKR